MPKTYDPIATQTLGSAQASVTFSSISQAYTDLILICSNITSSAASTAYMKLNGDTTSTYSSTYLNGNGSTASSGRVASNTTGLMVGSAVTGMSSTVPASIIIQFPNYSNATTYKTVLSRYSNSSGDVDAAVGLWRLSPVGINAINVLNPAGNFLTGSTFTLYGIKAA